MRLWESSQSDSGFALSSAFVEDDVHTPANPYCGDPTCWCHTELDHHHTVADFLPTEPRTEEEVQFAHHFLDIFGR